MALGLQAGRLVATMLDWRLMDMRGLRRLWRGIRCIATGCTPLDVALGGGLPSSHVTLVYGERSSGKTQLCHQVAAHQLATQEDRYAVYVDVDLSFSPSRLISMACRFKNLEQKALLSRLLYYKPSAFEDQYRLIELLDNLYAASPHDLLIIDSISTLARGEYGVAVVEMQRTLSAHVKQLQRYALKRNVAVLVTDNVHLVKSTGKELLLPVSHQAFEVSAVRLRLIKGPMNKRICRIEASPIHPEGEVLFSLTEEGLVD
ncbi:MAG: ATPase domain-containing protein [Candidatus Nezhaarchaeota archaeon]|nr:ATPase domain-containing protein [Candidatus Nezhaarchaeota archaeon]